MMIFYRSRTDVGIPLGTCIAAGAYTALWQGDAIIHWYWSSLF